MKCNDCGADKVKLTDFRPNPKKHPNKVVKLCDKCLAGRKGEYVVPNDEKLSTISVPVPEIPVQDKTPDAPVIAQDVSREKAKGILDGLNKQKQDILVKVKELNNQIQQVQTEITPLMKQLASVNGGIAVLTALVNDDSTTNS